MTTDQTIDSIGFDNAMVEVTQQHFTFSGGLRLCECTLNLLGSPNRLLVALLEAVFCFHTQVILLLVNLSILILFTFERLGHAAVGCLCKRKSATFAVQHSALNGFSGQFERHGWFKGRPI